MNSQLSKNLARGLAALGLLTTVLIAPSTAPVSAGTPPPPPPKFSKEFAPSTIGPGSSTTLTFTIDNGNSTPREFLNFVDNLPAGVTVATPPNASTTCGPQGAAGPTVTAAAGGGSISLADASVGALASCTVKVDVTSSTSDTHTNISGTLFYGGGYSAGTATADLTVSNSLPGFTKVFAPSTVSLGGRSTLTFTIDNRLGSDITNLDFTDSLPPGMVVASPSNKSTTCGNPSVPPTLTATPGSSTITLDANGTTSFPALGAESTCTVSVDVIGGSIGSLVNSVELDVLVGFSSVSAGKATAALDVTGTSLQLRKTFTTDPVVPGGQTTLEFEISNISRDDAATDITFSDDLDGMLTGLTATVPGTPSVPCGAGSALDYTTGVLTLTGGSLPAEGSCTFSVQLAVSAGATDGSYTNTTTAVSGTVGGSSTTGNKASDVLFVSSYPIVTKEFIDDPVGAGGSVTLEFTITNPGSSAMTDIDFFDEFDSILPTSSSGAPAPEFCGNTSTATFTALTNPPVPGAVVPATLVVSNARLAASGSAGDSCTFSIVLDVAPDAASGIYPNLTSEVTATINAMSVTGPPATDDLVVVEGPTLRKEFIDDPVDPGASVTLRFTLTHDALAAADATAIAFTDDLTTVMADLDATSVGTNTCIGSAVDITTPTLIDFSGGSLAPGGECFFDVVLTVPGSAAPGSHTNTTSGVSATVDGVTTVGNAASDDLQISSLVLTKEFTDDPTIAGDTATLRFTLTNQTAVTASSIFFFDNLDAALDGLVAVAPLPDTSSCHVDSSLSGTSTLVFSGGELLAGASCSFDVTVRVPATNGGPPAPTPDGTYVNVTSVVSSSLGSSAPAAGSLVVDSTQLQITKEFTDDPVVPGGTVTMEFTLTNLDAARAASAIDFADDLEAAMPGLTTTAATFNDCGGMATSVFPTGLFTYAGGALAAGASCTIRLSLLVPPGPFSGNTFTNTTQDLEGTIGGFDVVGEPASDVLRLQTLILTKSFDGPTTASGTADLTFTIRNVNTAKRVDSIAFSDDLDAALSGLVATSLPATPCGPGSTISGTGFLTLTGGNLLAGESCTFVVPVSVPVTATAGDHTNTTSQLFVAGLPVSGAATADLTIEPAPTFAKVFAPDSIVTTATSTLTFTIDNTASALAATGLGFTDSLPTDVAIATPASAATTCTGGTLTAAAGSGSISYTGGSVAAGASCTVTVNVTSSVAGAYVNTTGDLTSSSGISGTATDTLNVDPPPTFAKVFAPDSIAPGATSTLTLTVDNSASAFAATGLDFTDALPTGVFVATPSNAATTCAGGTLTAITGSGSVSYSGGSVAAGASCAVSVDVTSPVPGAHVNTTGDLTSSSGNSGTATDTLTVTAFVPPTFAKAFAQDTVVAGEPSVLTFTIGNSGSLVAATSLDFTDTLPAAIVVASPAGAFTTCAGGTLTAVDGSGSISYTGGTAPPSDSCTVSVVVVSSTVGAHVNTSGSLTSSSGNSGTATDTLNVEPAPTFAKVFAPNPIAPGATSTLTFTIDNSASALAAGGLDFTDALPTDVLVASTPNASTTCTAGTLTAVSGSGSISYTGGSVADGASCTVEVDVTSAAAGTHPNTTGDLTSSSGNSGTASDTLTVSAFVPPSFDKVFAPDTVVADQASTLTFTIGNSGSLVAATSLDFTDTLPTGVEVASPSGASTTCTGGTLTAVAGGGSISYADGTAPASGSCAVTVDVVSSTVGPHVNTTGNLTSSLGNSGTATDTLNVEPAPTFAKVFAPDTIAPGGVSTLTFTIDNSASALAATGFAFTDTFPTGVFIADPTGASTTCTGMGDAAAGNPSFTFGGVIAAGASCTVSVDVTSAVPGDHVNLTGDLTSSSGNSGTATDTLTVTALVPPTFAKAFGPDTVVADAATTLTFTINNAGSLVAATSLDFTDTLPAAIVVATPPDASTTCAGGTLTAAADSGSIAYTGGTAPPSDSCTISVDVVSSTVGAHANTTGNLTSSSGNSGTASDTLNVEPPPTFAKVFAPDTIAPGATSTLTFTIDNSASALAATGFAFTDTFPTGVFIADPTGASTTCAGMGDAAAGNPSFTFGGDIGAGLSCTVSLDVTSAVPGNHVNTTGDLTSSSGNSGPATDTLNVEPPPTFAKVFAPDSIAPGTTSTLTFTIDNTASSLDATDLAFTDGLPVGVVLATPLTKTNTCTGGMSGDEAGDTSFSFSGGTATAGATCTISVDVYSASPGTHDNTSGDLTSSLGNSGTATDTLTVTAFAPPAFTKVFAPDTIVASNISTLTFTIDNTASTVDATNLTFTDTFPTGVVIATPLTKTSTCTGGMSIDAAGATSFSFSGGTVAAGATCTISVDVTSSTAGDHVNLTGDLTSSSGNSGTATDTLTVTARTAPTVTINQASGQADPTNSAPINFTVVFNEAVTGFDAADVNVVNGTVASVTAAGTNTYTVAVTPAAQGLVTATVPAGGAVDNEGTPNTASTSSDNSVNYDSTVPTFNTQTVTVNNDPGKPGAVVNYTVSTTDEGTTTSNFTARLVTDDEVAEVVQPANFNCSPPSGSFFPIGTTQVTCTATDDAGNTSTGSFNVVVVDNEKPVISAAPDIKRTAQTGNSVAVTYPTPTTTDNSGTVTVVCTPASGSTFNVGNTTVTCTATDPAGNTASTTFTVTVEASAVLPATGGSLGGITVALQLLLAGLGLFTISRLRRRKHTARS